MADGLPVDGGDVVVSPFVFMLVEFEGGFGVFSVSDLIGYMYK